MLYNNELHVHPKYVYVQCSPNIHMLIHMIAAIAHSCDGYVCIHFNNELTF